MINAALNAEVQAQAEEIDEATADLTIVSSELRELRMDEAHLRKELKEGKVKLMALLDDIRIAKAEQAKVHAFSANPAACRHVQHTLRRVHSLAPARVCLGSARRLRLLLRALFPPRCASMCRVMHPAPGNNWSAAREPSKN